MELYERPYDERFPVICMDEQPLQLLKERQVPLLTHPRRPRRYDHCCERTGTASVFVFSEPLGNWHRPSVRERRTAVEIVDESSDRKIAGKLELSERESKILLAGGLLNYTRASV